jgi:antitoxin component of MazEF toxin-antitoxin module
VRLQKQLSKKVRDKEYAKWVVVIPPDKVKEAGWKEGEELDIDFKGDKFTITRKKKS